MLQQLWPMAPATTTWSRASRRWETIRTNLSSSQQAIYIWNWVPIFFELHVQWQLSAWGSSQCLRTHARDLAQPWHRDWVVGMRTATKIFVPVVVILIEQENTFSSSVAWWRSSDSIINCPVNPWKYWWTVLKTCFSKKPRCAMMTWANCFSIWRWGYEYLLSNNHQSTYSKWYGNYYWIANIKWMIFFYHKIQGE